MAFLTLAVITLMVALDGTSLSVALPVGRPTLIEGHPSNMRCCRLLHKNLGDPQLKPSGLERPFCSAPPSFNRILLPSPTSSVENL